MGKYEAESPFISYLEAEIAAGDSRLRWFRILACPVAAPTSGLSARGSLC